MTVLLVVACCVGLPLIFLGGLKIADLLNKQKDKLMSSLRGTNAPPTGRSDDT